MTLFPLLLILLPGYSVVKPFQESSMQQGESYGLLLSGATFKGIFSRLLPWLHEAIFLATCKATMTNKKPFKLQRGCYTQATCLATLRKVEGRSTCNSQRNNCSCKMGCYTWIFSCDLQVARKIVSCNIAFTDLMQMFYMYTELKRTIPEINVTSNQINFIVALM